MTRATLSREPDHRRPGGPEIWTLKQESTTEVLILGRVVDITMGEAISAARALGYDATCSTNEPAVLQGVE